MTYCKSLIKILNECVIQNIELQSIREGTANIHQWLQNKKNVLRVISRITIASFLTVCSFARLFFFCTVCTSNPRLHRERFTFISRAVRHCLFDRNHHKNNIIPLKMKNESCVRCKSSDCALLFHY